MKIVKFYGGLGNQMFQYAMLVALREKWHEEALMDISLYKTYGLHNGFELPHLFKITSVEASREQIAELSRYTTNYKFARLIHYLLPAKKSEFKERTFGKYYPDALECSNDVLFDGYWQHFEYFDPYREAILKEFSLKNELDGQNGTFIKILKKSNKTVSVHVRRGDYLKSKKYRGLCSVDYYRAAISKVKIIVGEDAQFYFFSNDINWCKENLSDLISKDSFNIVDWNRGSNSYKDMILMSCCRINIIANSSFSWWGAYLNQREDKAIIAPSVWVNLPIDNPIQLPEWIKL